LLQVEKAYHAHVAGKVIAGAATAATEFVVDNIFNKKGN